MVNAVTVSSKDLVIENINDIEQVLHDVSNAIKSDLDLANEILEVILSRSKSLFYQEGILKYYLLKSEIYIQKSNFEKAFSYIVEAEDFYNLNNLDEYCFLLINKQYGAYYSCIGNFKDSFVYFEKGLTIAEKINDLQQKNIISNGIASLSFLIGEYDKALTYFQSTLEYFEFTKDRVELPKVYSNIGCCYVKLSEYDKAINYLNKSIDYSIEFNNKVNEATALDELATIKLQKNPGEGFKLYRKAITILESVNHTYTLNLVRLNYASALLQFKQYDYCYTLITIIKESLENNEVIDILRDLYNIEYRYFEEINQYKEALESYKRYVEYDCMLRKEEISKDIMVLETKKILKRHNTLKSLSEIGKEITSILELDTLLEYIYNHIIGLMDAYIVGIAVIKGNKISFDYFIENGVKLPVIIRDIDDYNSLSSYIVRNNTDLIINNIDKELYLYLNEVKNLTSKIVGRKVNSLVYLPLRYKGEIFGLLTVQSHVRNIFTDELVDTIRIISSYLAIAIKNANQSELIKRQNDQLIEMSNCDDLTKLYNRRYFNIFYNQAFDMARDERRTLGLILIDLDNFKLVNDQYGHLAGDGILKITAQEISLTNNDLIESFRIGGEEFVIITFDCDKDKLIELAEDLKERIANATFIHKNQEIKITASIGLSTIIPPQDNTKSADSFFALVDMGMYRAKANGKNKVVYYE